MSTSTPSPEPNVPAKEAGQPRLVAPIGGMPVDGSAVLFSWAEAPGAQDYRLQVAADAHFEHIVCTLETGPTTLFTLLEMLPQDGSVFYWRMQTQTTSGWQPWSPAEHFKARTDQHEIAFRAKQEASTQSAQPSVATKPEAAIAFASAPELYQAGRTSKVTMILILAVMLATFAATFAYMVYVVNTAQ